MISGNWTNISDKCLVMNSANFDKVNKRGMAIFSAKKACTATIKFTVKEPDGVNRSETTKTLSLKTYPVISREKQASLQSLVKSYAWGTFDSTKTERLAQYNDALNGNYKGGCDGNDSSAFVGLAVRKSGIDASFPGNTTDKVYSYLNSSSDWMDVTERVRSNKDARPGDVIITCGKGHMLLYVGRMNGFDSVMASAAYSKDCKASRAPMADKRQYVHYYQNVTYNGNKYAIFRHK